MAVKFANGCVAKLPSESAPSFVKMKLSFKVAEFAQFLSENENNNGWVNVDILESKDGTKIYAAINEHTPEKPKTIDDTEADSAIPF